MVFMYVNVLANKNTSLNICVFANMWIINEGALERMHAFDQMNDIINKPTQEKKTFFGCRPLHEAYARVHLSFVKTRTKNNT